MNTKVHKISLRLSNDEKTLMLARAKGHGMTMSEYIRYKLLEDKAPVEKRVNSLEANQDLIIKLIINGYLKITAMANKTLSEAELEEIKASFIEQQKKLEMEKL